MFLKFFWRGSEACPQITHNERNAQKKVKIFFRDTIVYGTALKTSFEAGAKFLGLSRYREQALS